MEPTQTPPASPDPAVRSRRIAPGHTRCRARKRDGKRCRLHSDSSSGLCPRHALRRPTPRRSRGLRPLRLLLFPTDQFDSACQINDFLSTVIDLVVKNEISARRAAVLAYITNQLLRTLPIIQQECPPKIIFDLPRPKPTLERAACRPEVTRSRLLQYYESLAP
jgi:hypothetical protein